MNFQNSASGNTVARNFIINGVNCNYKRNESIVEIGAKNISLLMISNVLLYSF